MLLIVIIYQVIQYVALCLPVPGLPAVPKLFTVVLVDNSCGVKLDLCDHQSGQKETYAQLHTWYYVGLLYYVR